MAWPSDDLNTDEFDSPQDSVSAARPMLKKLIEKVQSILSARGSADGICELGPNAKVPGGRLARGDANGLASLDASSTVPVAQLPAANADARGAVQLATNAEVVTATDDAKAITPATALIRGISFTKTTSGSGNTVGNIDLGFNIDVAGQLNITLHLSKIKSSSYTPPPPPKHTK